MEKATAGENAKTEKEAFPLIESEESGGGRGERSWTMQDAYLFGELCGSSCA